jgi:hypothetical protein
VFNRQECSVTIQSGMLRRESQIRLIRCVAAAVFMPGSSQVQCSSHAGEVTQQQAERIWKEAAVKRTPNLNEILIEDPPALQVSGKAQAKCRRLSLDR